MASTWTRTDCTGDYTALADTVDRAFDCDSYGEGTVTVGLIVAHNGRIVADIVAVLDALQK